MVPSPPPDCVGKDHVTVFTTKYLLTPFYHYLNTEVISFSSQNFEGVLRSQAEEGALNKFGGLHFTGRKSLEVQIYKKKYFDCRPKISQK